MVSEAEFSGLRPLRSVVFLDEGEGRFGDFLPAAVDQASERDRALLLDTFGAWLDADGSADRAAAALFCHPNTVRHRLRRLQDQTGRSLSQPRELAELTLAFEIDRRITDPAP